MSDLNRITYVEDEPDIRQVAELALAEVGNFTLDICCNGTEAIEKAPAFGPDLILLDVMMPDMDGVETYRRLREIPSLAETPVIFMTAKVQSHELEKYRQLGAIDIIPKPFDPMTLSQTINDIWSRFRESQNT